MPAGLVAIIWALIAGRGRPGKGQISKARPDSKREEGERNVRDEFLDRVKTEFPTTPRARRQG